MSYMAQNSSRVGQLDAFTLLRFAEYRPSTFTSDFTIEIPTLAQFITDETFQPINIVVWLELTSLTMKQLHLICSRLEELISTTMDCGKEIFRTFPPSTDSFGLTIHLLQYDTQTNMINDTIVKKAYDEIASTLFKGLAWDLEKWISKIYKENESKSTYDATKWNVQEAVKYIQDKTTLPSEKPIQDVNLLLLSCWHTEGPFEELFQTVSPFAQTLVSWNYLYTISPVNSMTVGLADLLEIDLRDLLVPEKQLGHLQDQWKNTLLTLIEPILEVEIKPSSIGTNYNVATNLPFFKKQKDKDQGLLIYNLQSQRYPIRINLLFNLPVPDRDATQLDYNPVVLESIELYLRTSIGKEFKKEGIKDGTTYRLSTHETIYQPERELNARMRRVQRLKTKLSSIVEYQSEISAQINKIINEPEYLEQAVDEQLLQESISDLKLAFEIIDYLQEQELLLAELPPISKKFEPPKNGNSLI